MPNGINSQNPPLGLTEHRFRDTREAVLDRLQWQLAELRTHLDRLAAANAIMAVELSRPVPLVW
jgi:hypothetical protein